MDLIKTGKFLARLRREAGYTQERLGEKLGVSNKTVSRWETGAYLPPVEMLQAISDAISDLYGVSINELLAGERLEGEAAYRAAAEENLTQVMRESTFSLEERRAYYKKKWRRDHAPALLLGGILPVAALFTDMAFLWLAAPLPAQAVYLIAYNRMMGYVERRAFYPREDGGEER